MSGIVWSMTDNNMTEDERTEQNEQLAADFEEAGLPYTIAADGSVIRPPFNFIPATHFTLK